jgi:L-amino acid N-acyltransferase YncA
LINFDDIEIRDAGIEDLTQIVDIYNSTIPSRMVTADTEPVSVQSREKWYYDHSPSFRPLWVMNYQGEMCGWLSFQSFYGRPAYNGTAEVSIYISEKFRSFGLGRFILGKAIEACPSIGVKSLLGFIFYHNKPSLNLFYSFGFTDWAHLPRVAEMDGLERDLIIVGKRVE